MTSFSIDLADDMANSLREIAEVTAETPDSIIRRAVEELVADYVDGRIAMQRVEDPLDELISSGELHHRGEGVDIVPGPAGNLALAVATLAEVPVSDRGMLTRKLGEQET